MIDDNETLDEKYNRFLKLIEHYTVKVDAMLADMKNVTTEDLVKVLTELQAMYDESVRTEMELQILQTMLRVSEEKNGT